MSPRRLPSNPSLEHLRNEARDLQRRVREGDADALVALAAHHPRPPAMTATLRLSDAQLAVARSYGFASWTRLRRHLDVVDAHTRSPHLLDVDSDLSTGDRFLALACLTYGGSDSPDRWRTAREILDADPDVGATDIWTMAAAGEVDAARELLAADPSLARRPGGPHRWEPLLYAAYSRVALDPGRSRLGVARLLLDHGADPDAGYLWEGLPSPFTALTGALGGGEDAVNQPPHPDGEAFAALLLERGADPNDNQGLYNRMFDPSDHHLELLLAHGLGRGDGGPWRRRLPDAAESIAAMLAMQLQWAAEHDLVDRARLLLGTGLDPDAQSGHPAFGGRRAIELAARRGNDDVVRLLIDAGAAPPDLPPGAGLLAACLRGDAATAEALVAADPELIELLDADAPVLVAAELGRIDAVRLLVRLGCDVDRRRRITALHEAASNGDAGLVRVLLDLGADPNVVDESFDAPALGWARHNGHEEVVAILEPLTPPG